MLAQCRWQSAHRTCHHGTDWPTQNAANKTRDGYAHVPHMPSKIQNAALWIHSEPIAHSLRRAPLRQLLDTPNSALSFQTPQHLLPRPPNHQTQNPALNTWTQPGYSCSTSEPQPTARSHDAQPTFPVTTQRSPCVCHCNRSPASFVIRQRG